MYFSLLTFFIFAIYFYVLSSRLHWHTWAQVHPLISLPFKHAIFSRIYINFLSVILGFELANAQRLNRSASLSSGNHVPLPWIGTKSLPLHPAWGIDYMHNYTHTHEHAHTCSLTLTHTNMHTHAASHSHTRTCTRAWGIAFIHTHTRSHAQIKKKFEDLVKLK